MVPWTIRRGHVLGETFCRGHVLSDRHKMSSGMDWIVVVEINKVSAHTSETSNGNGGERGITRPLSSICVLRVDILGRTLYRSCHYSLLPPVGVATVAPPSPTKPKKGKAALPLKSDRIEAPHMHKAHKKRRALGFRALRLGAA
ncbi:hypothetical protein Tco_1450194 [Tanacetum coccineum]